MIAIFSVSLVYTGFGARFVQARVRRSCFARARVALESAQSDATRPNLQATGSEFSRRWLEVVASLARSFRTAGEY
jgi:hypothetical protein